MFILALKMYYYALCVQYYIVQPDFGLWCGQFFFMLFVFFFYYSLWTFTKHLFTVWLINQALKFFFCSFKHSVGLWLSPHTILKTFLIDFVCCGLLRVWLCDVLPFCYVDSLVGQYISMENKCDDIWLCVKVSVPSKL